MIIKGKLKEKKLMQKRKNKRDEIDDYEFCPADAEILNKMVVLNIYGKIQPICISKKLKLYIANLLNNAEDNWNKELVAEMKASWQHNIIEYNKLGLKHIYDICDIFQKKFPEQKIEFSANPDEYFQEIADNMIYLYFDYSYEDMPLGDWDTNPFDGRLCEEDYAEKIINFINYLINDALPELLQTQITWIYSSNHNENDCRIFWGGPPLLKGIQTLKKWGEIFDNFLNTKNDYLQLDYLFNSLHKDNEYDEYHYFKSYSLCQMLLENNRETELDWKLLEFIDERFSKSEREEVASILRQIRNKIGHGDFIELEKKLEEFAAKTMDRKFCFDYSEYSRRNWIISSACCMVDECVRNIIFNLLTDRDKINSIKRATKK